MLAAGDAMPAVLERDMSASLAEFVRGLEAAFVDSVEGGPESFHIVDNGATMEIDVQIGPPRIIALLQLPTLKVRIRFTGGQPAQHRVLLERMDRAMHRGGG